MHLNSNLALFSAFVFIIHYLSSYVGTTAHHMSHDFTLREHQVPKEPTDYYEVDRAVTARFLCQFAVLVVILFRNLL